ncbi:MAG: ribonuclease HI [Elainellaceae cyanobacterium]
MIEKVIEVIEKIYTDGACSGNPGPGGWGVVMYFAGGAAHELGGFAPDTTNNRMELQGAIAALDCLTQILPSLAQTSPITLYTDSEYVKNGITKWIKGWQKKGWKTSAGKPVLNMDLWKELDQLNQAVQAMLPLHWQYVKGHSGDIGNDRTDAIATGFAQRHPPSLRTVKLDTLLSHAEAEAESLAASNAASKPQSSPTKASQAKASQAKASQAKASKTKASQAQAAQAQDGEAVNVSNGSAASAMNKTPSGDENPAPADSNAMHPSPENAGRSPMEMLRSLLEAFHLADEIANEGYILTSAEVADLVGISSATVTSKGDSWIWRNWKIQRTQHEGQQVFWQLERIR